MRGEIERYHDSLIAYCLGNLVFDEQSCGGNEGYILTCRLHRAGVADYALVPVQVISGLARIDRSGEGFVHSTKNITSSQTL